MHMNSAFVSVMTAVVADTMVVTENAIVIVIVVGIPSVIVTVTVTGDTIETQTGIVTETVTKAEEVGASGIVRGAEIETGREIVVQMDRVLLLHRDEGHDLELNKSRSERDVLANA